MTKKPWYKRWWAITIYIILALGIIGNLIDEEPISTSKETLTKIETDTKLLESSSTKDLFEMLPSRQDIPTEFKIDSPYNFTPSQIPIGFNSGGELSTTKIVGATGAGLIVIDFNIIKFKSDGDARKYHLENINRIKNEGGYTEKSISVPSRAECFSFTEDYGFQGRFATSNCLKGNLAYQVIVTATQTLEKPERYLKNMITLFDNKINK